MPVAGAWAAAHGNQGKGRARGSKGKNGKGPSYNVAAETLRVKVVPGFRKGMGKVREVNYIIVRNWFAWPS